MTNVMLNTQLYQKMYAELEQYKAYLLTSPSAEILDHASEYICREYILMVMESNDLNKARAKTLLKSSTPLADVLTNTQGGNIAGHCKKSGMQLKLVLVKCYELNLQQLTEQKGRWQYAIHSARNH